MKRYVNIKNARSGEYRKVIEEIAAKGVCPFCAKDFKTEERKKHIFKEKDAWFLTENNWPYPNTDRHFIIISNKHKENLSEMSKKDWETVSFLMDWAIKKFDIKGGGMTARFGDTDYTGASVAHLHFHLIYPHFDKKINSTKIVNFPIG